MMKVELSRFRVNDGKSNRVDAWLAILNERHAECIQTLEREQMKLEVIFREMIDGVEYLTWFSVQDDSGEDVKSSEFEVDRLHVAFHNECVDHDYGRRDAQPVLVLVPEVVARAMEWEDPAAAIVPFERREIIYRRPGG